MGFFERRKVGLILTPALFVVTWFAPLGLEPRQQHLAAIFAAVIVAWVTEVMPIAVTALLIAPAMIVVGVTDSRAAFAPYADPLIFLFIGGFFIARAMMRHGLDRRIARSLMSFRLVRGSPTRIRMAFMMTAVVLSMWISNTATAAILVPILLGTLPENDQTASGSVLAIAYAAYALTVVPMIEPPLSARGPGEVPIGARDRTDARLHQYDDLFDALFPPKAWEREGPKVLESDQAMLLLKEHRQVDKNRLKIEPCTMILFPQPRERVGSAPQPEKQ